MSGDDRTPLPRTTPNPSTTDPCPTLSLLVHDVLYSTRSPDDTPVSVSVVEGVTPKSPDSVGGREKEKKTKIVFRWSFVVQVEV